MTKNSARLYEQHFKTTDADFTLEYSGRAVLPANMAGFQQLSLGTIDSSNKGRNLIVVSDRPITIGVNDTSKIVDAEILVMSNSATATAVIEALYVKNTDPDNTASVEYAVTD